MRGNWNTGEPRTESTGQQITAEHCGLPHSPATPAWNIADRIVKEEPTEDKNNDSGVSPGHYTSNSASPRSRRSSSTANGSLSPGSATSQDSNVMQYEYSPQRRLFKTSGGSPVNFDIGNPVAGIVRKTGYGESTIGEIEKTERMQTDQTIENVSSPIRPDSKDGESMQCPVCPFTTIHRMQFNEHLITHCSPKCDTGDLSKSVYNNNASSMSEDGMMNSPSQGERSEHEFDETDEPGLRVPRVNSQGKVKTFRCKQCNFVAVTKLEFWEHSRGHIKADKLLTCPKCPFVTEYKHHLEYHLRNHFGSKPFKCDKCPYSCVNKSMLNSHLKSHSNVYQYRCANCSYATKYCHSLKLHLRKYSHKPAMVLNPDGSPNPLPIIDIYGTRRGPKQKPAKTDQEVSVSVSVSHPLNPSTMMTSLAPTRDLKPYSKDIFQPQINVPFAYGQIFNTVNHFLRFHENNNDNKNKVDATCRPSMPIYDPFGAAYRREISEGPVSPDLKTIPRDFFNNEPIVRQPSQLCLPVLDDAARPLSIVPPPPPPPPLTVRFADDHRSKTNASPLDLSKSDATTRSKVNNVNNDSPRASGTSRRKGRAFKLDRLIVEHDSDDNDDADNNDDNKDNVNGNGDDDEEADECDADADADADADDDDDDDDDVASKQRVPSPSASSTNDAVRNEANNGSEAAVASSDYVCQFCDIAFGNVVMYTMHMSYHGYNNPYACNMCGQECTDKVSFFLHIARTSHA